MQIEFDLIKDAENQRKHGISLSAIEHLEFDRALVWPDKRRDYGEKRIAALGLIGQRVHFLVFTMRAAIIRPISLRKANKRETKRYRDARIK